MTVDTRLYRLQVQCVEDQHCRRYDHDQSEEQKSVADVKRVGQYGVPAQFRMHSPKNSLCEDEVDQVDDQDTGIIENLCCDGDLDVSLHGSPNNSHDAGNNSCHAESKENGTEQELVVSLAVSLEDGHVGSGKAKV